MSKVSRFKVGQVYRVVWLGKTKGGTLLHARDEEVKAVMGCSFRGECKETGEVMLRFVVLKEGKGKRKGKFATDPNAPILTTTAVRCKGEGYGARMEIAPYWNCGGGLVFAFLTSNDDLPSDKVLKKIKPAPFGS